MNLFCIQIINMFQLNFYILVYGIVISVAVPESNISSESGTQNRTSAQSYKPGDKSYQKCLEYDKLVREIPEPKKPPEPYVMERYIHNGLVVLKQELPYMTAIGYNTNEGKMMWLCGGSLISERFVLTAAHCCFSSTWGNATTVRLGDLNLHSDKDDESARNYEIIERIKHPNYTSKSYYHDLALLKLAKNVEFSKAINPICLWTADRVLEYPYAQAAGWGRRNWDDRNITGILLKVSLTLTNNSYCNRIYIDEIDKLSQGIVSEWQVCAGGNFKDTCQGDSGGPLFKCSVIDDNVLCFALGITSVGKICEGIVPGVYTRVSHYVSWIEEIVWP